MSHYHYFPQINVSIYASYYMLNKQTLLQIKHHFLFTTYLFIIFSSHFLYEMKKKRERNK